MDKDQVPESVHVGGDTLSFSEIARVMEEAGAGKIEVTEVDLHEHKQKALIADTADPAKYLRFLMGENKINHTVRGLGCDNELLNPGEKRWQWKTMKDLARETGGKPWADHQWPPE